MTDNELLAFYPTKPKFEIGEFAKHGYGAEKGIVKITSRSYRAPQGWVYGHEYRTNFGISGGSCGWPAEKEYLQLTDPIDKLRAAIATRRDKKRDMEWHMKRLNEDLAKLEFTLTEILK